MNICTETQNARLKLLKYSFTKTRFAALENDAAGKQNSSVLPGTPIVTCALAVWKWNGY